MKDKPAYNNNIVLTAGCNVVLYETGMANDNRFIRALLLLNMRKRHFPHTKTSKTPV